MAPASLAARMAEIKANPGKRYVYVLHRPDGTPFYVGVGTNRRIMHHERNAESAKQSAKYEVMRTIASQGGQVGYSIAGWFDGWEDAAAEERRLIALHGRADLGKGPLANRTNGGQGQAGINGWHTPARLAGVKRAAEKNKGRKLSPEHLAKISAGMKGHVWRQETLDRRSAALKGRPLPDEHKAKLAVAKAGRGMGAACNGARDEWFAKNRDKVSEKFKGIWADPAIRAAMMEKRKGQTRSPEVRARMRAGMLKKLEDPEFRARREAAQLAGIERWKEKSRKAKASAEIQNRE